MTEGIQNKQVPNDGPDILILGGGPAGSTVAIGLQRLGYQVSLLHSPRLWSTCEGISSRTLEGLRSAGLHRALDTVPPPTPRHVNWNGDAGSANTEHLVQREKFDAALLEDLSAAGVTLQAGLSRSISRSPEGHTSVEFETTQGTKHVLHCHFLVDARGRAASGTGPEQLRGPGTVSLLRIMRQAPVERGSQVHSFRDGWAWLANTADGLTFLQLTVDAASAKLPKRAELNRWFEQQLRQLSLPEVEQLNNGTLQNVVARGSTSILQGGLVSNHLLRVGDAAMAVDPLSGNGIFQSLSSALVAPAVINTLLQKPEDTALAKEFYQQRVRHTFLRFARTGRDFYGMESRWPESPFWRERRAWPDTEPSHPERAPTFISVEHRPVLANGQIISRPVVITSDQPLGVWHVAGIELSALLRELPPNESQRKQLLVTRVENACAGDPVKNDMLMAWLARYQIA